jgi:hypothetical protein
LIGLAGLLAIVLPFGCGKIEEPKEQDYYLDSSLSYVDWREFPGGAYLTDLDGDGKVDVIREGKNPSVARYIQPGYEEQAEGRVELGLAKPMTPGIRDSASRLLKAQNDLAYEFAKRAYELALEQSKQER